jgi:hypothetical protein
VSTKTKGTSNLFDEDITAFYELARPEPRPNAYAIQVVEVLNDDEQYMLDKFHEQSIAIEGRSAIAQHIDTRIGEIATNTAYVMAGTMVNVERIETAASLGRLGKRLQEFDNRLLDLTAKHLLETDTIAIRTMHEDIRRSVYKPPPPPPVPPRPKRKGLIPGFVEFLFGEA